MKSIKKILPEKIVHIISGGRIWLKKKIRLLQLHVPNDERVYFDVDTIANGHFKVTYRGISAIRCPFDYVLYQMILFQVKPDLVIEIGANYGGGALYIADLMDLIGHGEIHTIDIEEKITREARNHPRINFFLGGWQKYDVQKAKGFRKILVIEDGSHEYKESLDALNKFAPLVSRDSYYIVEDGIVNALGREAGFDGGPLRAVREFLEGNDDFQIDRNYTDMFGKNATFNVNGYLKRVQ